MPFEKENDKALLDIPGRVFMTALLQTGPAVECCTPRAGLGGVRSEQVGLGWVGSEQVESGRVG